MTKNIYAHKQKQRRVLICDDNEGLLYILNQIFQREGYIVNTIASLDKLKDYFNEYTPDVAIMDYNFGSENSAKIIMNLKEIFSQTRFVLISSVDNIANIAQELSLKYYFRKPFSIKKLVAKINEITK